MADLAIQSILEDAKAAGLLNGEKTAHVSVRTTEALLNAAKRQTGIRSTTELVQLALASLAMPDPVSRFMIDHLGTLGEDHTLEF